MVVARGLRAGVGSAVGIGNLWRFPYVVGTSGGGAFLSPYVIAVRLCGLPLMVLAFSRGRRFRSPVVRVLAAMHCRLGWVGFGLVGVQTVILSYYLVVTVKCSQFHSGTDGTGRRRS